MLSWLFNIKLKKLQSSIMKQQADIARYMENIDQYEGRIPEYCTINGGECTSTGLLMWEKDLNHRYTYANMRHCNDFYHLPVAKLNRIIGKTDSELISEFITRTGMENTFGEMCISTDEYALIKNKLCRFWEVGYVNNKILILDVRKQPLLDENNKIKGTRGWASNLSDRECEMKTLIEIYLKNGMAERLDISKGKGVASYLITKQHNHFDWRFPF